MKKLFSTCLMALAVATMSAQDVPFSVIPADGSTVQSITATNPVILSLDEGYAEFEINSKDDIYFTKDGEKYCGILRSGDGDPIEIKPAEDLTSPGTYQLVIGEGALCWYDKDYNPTDNPKELVYTYTIGSETTGGESSGLPFVAEPEDGSTVSALTYVVLELKDDVPYTHFEVNTQDDIYFAYEGEYFCAAECNEAGSVLEIYPEYVPDFPGEFQLIIEQGAISWADDDYTMFSDNQEQIVLNYTIEAEEPTPADYPFTVSPEPGSTLEELSSFTIALKPDNGYTWIDIDSYEVYILNAETGYPEENVTVSVVQDPSDMTSYTITVVNEDGEPAPLTLGGDYQLFITWQALTCGDDAGDLFYINESSLRFDYTVSSPIKNPEGVPFVITEPQSSTVESVYYASLELDGESGFTSFIVENEAGVYFTKDGEMYTTTSCIPSARELQINPDDYITTSGNYALVVKAGALSWTNGTEVISNTEDLVYEFTVVATEAKPLPFYLTPEQNSTIDELSEVTVSLIPDLGYDYIDISTYDAYVLDEDYEPIGYLSAYQDPADITSYTLTFMDLDENPCVFNEPGAYTLAFEDWSIECSNDDYDPFYINEEPLFFTYYVTGSAEKEPVVYDVEPKAYSPDNGAEIDYESRDLATIIIYVEEGIEPAESAVAYLILTDDPEVFEEAPIKKNKMPGQLIIDFAPAEYSGEYEVYIPEGSFGDAAWLADAQTGHTNPEISLSYTLINAKSLSNVEYSLACNVEPSADYKTFTVSFKNREVQMVENASATLSSTEARYSKYAEFKDLGNGVFTVEFDEAPAEPALYVFTIEEGMFGDSEFIESDEKEGFANARVDISYDIKTVGIDTISDENAPEGVYNLMGVKVGETTENLPAGIYIVNGKKVVVK